jgi:hypothetical protein
MRSVLVNGEIAPSDLGSLFGSVGAESQGAVAFAFGETRIALYVGRKFYFRSNDYLGLVILAATNGVTTRIDLSYAGGGSGLLGIQLGAGDDLEAKLYEALVGLLQSRSLGFSDA